MTAAYTMEPPRRSTIESARLVPSGRFGDRWHVTGSCGHRGVLPALDLRPVLGLAYACPLCPGGWAGPTP